MEILGNDYEIFVVGLIFEKIDSFMKYFGTTIKINDDYNR